MVQCTEEQRKRLGAAQVPHDASGRTVCMVCRVCSVQDSKGQRSRSLPTLSLAHLIQHPAFTIQLYQYHCLAGPTESAQGTGTLRRCLSRHNTLPQIVQRKCVSSCDESSRKDLVFWKSLSVLVWEAYHLN